MARPLNEHESNLLVTLLGREALKRSAPDGLDVLRVRELDDGGMGSLRILHGDLVEEDRVMLERVAERQFCDVDGVPILVSINVDLQGRLFELDVWKADFSPVIRFPGS
jgi:hypothetical protein